MRCRRCAGFVVALILVLHPWPRLAVADASTPEIDRLQGLGRTEFHQLTHEPLEQTYYVFVRLPEGYDAKRSYPTVYLLDGGITFPLLGAYYRYLKLSGEAPDLIVVGISYGTAEPADGNQRSRDFTAPSEEREWWGGAAKFSDFLRRDVFPTIERTYASDPARRIVFGQSLGGQYALYAAQVEAGLFWGHIASNPALHRNLDFFLGNRPKGDAEIRLFVSSGSEDDPRFLEPAKRWVEHWSAKSEAGWALKTEVLEGQTHFSAAPEAFRRGLAWMFVPSE